MKKKDGRTRWVTDLREFNKQTVKDSYSLKNIQEIVHSLQGATVFSSLDEDISEDDGEMQQQTWGFSVEETEFPFITTKSE